MYIYKTLGNRMKKIIPLFLFCFASLFAKSQVFTKPNNNYGNIYNRGSWDSTAYFPTINHSPSGTTDLNSYGVSGAGQILSKGAILLDSLLNQWWGYNPRTQTWSLIGSAGSPFGPVTGTVNRISVLNGSTTPEIDIDANYAGQTSITKLGTIATGVWQGTAISDTYISSAASWNAKLNSALGSAHIFVGSSLNVATDVPLSGDVAISNLGAATVTGLRGKALPLSTVMGYLRYNGTNLIWDDTTYLRNIHGSAPIAFDSVTGIISLNTSGISAGSCTDCNLTVDAYGRVTAKSNGTGGSGIQNLYPQSGIKAIDDSTFELGGTLIHNDTISLSNAWMLFIDSAQSGSAKGIKINFGSDATNDMIYRTSNGTLNRLAGPAHSGMKLGYNGTNLIWQDTSANISGSIAVTQVAYGSATNVITSTSDFTFTALSKKLCIGCGTGTQTVTTQPAGHLMQFAADTPFVAISMQPTNAGGIEKGALTLQALKGVGQSTLTFLYLNYDSLDLGLALNNTQYPGFNTWLHMAQGVMKFNGLPNKSSPAGTDSLWLLDNTQKAFKISFANALSGAGGVSGSGAINQVAYFNGTSSVTSDGNFTYDPVSSSVTVINMDLFTAPSLTGSSFAHFTMGTGNALISTGGGSLRQILISGQNNAVTKGNGTGAVNGATIFGKTDSIGYCFGCVSDGYTFINGINNKSFNAATSLINGQNNGVSRNINTLPGGNSILISGLNDSTSWATSQQIVSGSSIIGQFLKSRNNTTNTQHLFGQYNDTTRTNTSIFQLGMGTSPTDRRNAIEVDTGGAIRFLPMTASSRPTGINGWVYYDSDSGGLVQWNGSVYLKIGGSGGSGFTNPMTAAGQMIFGGTSGTPTATATPNHSNMRPVWDGSVVKWTDTTASGNATLTVTQIGFGSAGNLLTGSANNVWDNTNFIQTITTGTTANTFFPSFKAVNTGTASAGNQMYGGFYTSEGIGWKTNATAAGQTVAFRWGTVPVQGAANPTGQWTLQQNINGAGYASVLTVNSNAIGVVVSSTGIQQAGGGLNFSGGATSASQLIASSGVWTFSYSATPSATGQTVWSFTHSSSTATSGTTTHVNIGSTFAPTSGTALYHNLVINPTINQTGGANGITRGLYINPTLTAAADWRAIEIALGKVVFAASTSSTTSINIPNGTAVTSPNNGDIYSDGTSLFYRQTNSLKLGINFSAAASGTTGTVSQSMTNLSAITVTPTGAITFNATGGVGGQFCSYVITTSGTSSFVITFGTNMKSTGTLTTGTVSGKVFTVNFVYDGTNWNEVSRTAAM